MISNDQNQSQQNDHIDDLLVAQHFAKETQDKEEQFTLDTEKTKTQLELQKQEQGTKFNVSGHINYATSLPGFDIDPNADDGDDNDTNLLVGETSEYLKGIMQQYGLQEHNSDDDDDDDSDESEEDLHLVNAANNESGNTPRNPFVSTSNTKKINAESSKAQENNNAEASNFKTQTESENTNITQNQNKNLNNQNQNQIQKKKPKPSTTISSTVINDGKESLSSLPQQIGNDGQTMVTLHLAGQIHSIQLGPESSEGPGSEKASSSSSKLVVIRALEGEKALDLESLLVLDNRQVLGIVVDVFGSIHAPYYLVFVTMDSESGSESDKSSTKSFQIGDSVYYTRETPTIPGVMGRGPEFAIHVKPSDYDLNGAQRLADLLNQDGDVNDLIDGGDSESECEGQF